MRRFCAALCLLLLVSSACGGGDQSADGEPGGTPSSQTAPSPKTPSSENPSAEPESPNATSTGAATGTDATTNTDGASSSSTTTTTTTTPPPPEGLRPLVVGHNNLAADRLNLIFAPWGWDSGSRFEAVVELFLGWDQRAQLINSEGMAVSGSQRADNAQLGLFGFEPFRSNPDKFNLWLTDVEPPGPARWLHSRTLPFDLPDQSIVTMALNPDRAVPGIYSVAGQDSAFSLQEEPMRRGLDSVANVMVFIDGEYPAGTMLDLPHELGHALFGFADEYIGRQGLEEEGLPPRIDIWPSCAASMETAERWWGDLLGQYDPMIDVWADEMTAAGFGYLVGDVEQLRDLVRIDYVEDGCFGDPGSVRSAEDTLMGFNQRAFGLSNRRSAERILELWEG